MKPSVHLSRQELLTLIFDKLENMRAELEHMDGESKLTPIRKRTAVVAAEALRIQRLIEEHAAIADFGHCVYCGKTIDEHVDAMTDPLPPDAKVSPKGEAERPPSCRYLRGLFDSLELATYQPLPLPE